MPKTNPVEEFKRNIDESERNYNEQIRDLRRNLSNGKAGVVKEQGQWRIDVGNRPSFDEAFGKGHR